MHLYVSFDLAFTVIVSTALMRANAWCFKIQRWPDPCEGCKSEFHREISSKCHWQLHAACMRLCAESSRANKIFSQLLYGIHAGECGQRMPPRVTLSTAVGLEKQTWCTPVRCPIVSLGQRNRRPDGTGDRPKPEVHRKKWYETR